MNKTITGMYQCIVFVVILFMKSEQTMNCSSNKTSFIIHTNLLIDKIK